MYHIIYFFLDLFLTRPPARGNLCKAALAASPDHPLSREAFLSINVLFSFFIFLYFYFFNFFWPSSRSRSIPVNEYTFTIISSTGNAKWLQPPLDEVTIRPFPF